MLRWLETSGFSPDTGTMVFWLEVPRITRCRVLVARGSETRLCEATEKLREYWQFAQTTHNTPQMIEILLLQAMVYRKQGRTDKALAVLERAVTVAWAGGYISPFVNLGKEMADLVRPLLQRGKAVDYIGRILTAFDGYKFADERDKPSPQSEQHPWMHNQALDEPLTNRELEILSFLAQGCWFS